MIEVLFYMLIMMTAWPVGYLLAYLCKDELCKDRKYFLIISCLLLIVSLIFLISSLSPSIVLAPIYLVFVLSVLVSKRRIKSKKK